MRLIVAAVMFLATPLAAQERMVSTCFAFAQNTPGVEYLHLAAVRTPIADDETVRITYIDHAMFLIEAGDTSIVTDYSGFIGPTDFQPDVVTMNRAHGTHWTANVDPGIPHVLPGWSDRFGLPIDHYLDLGDVIVRNVPTNIRSGAGVEENGNSIFVFEAGGLCIGHLGHLHHEPSDAHYAALGRLDVVMAPVDGGMTVPIETMIAVTTRLRSSIVIPMHWFGRGTLDDFLRGMSTEFAIDRPGGNTIEVSLRDLPSRPTVTVLEPRYLD